MTSKFTMREMIEATLEVYQSLYDASLAEEQAAQDAAAVKRTNKSLKRVAKSIPESTYVKIDPIDNHTKIKLSKENPKPKPETPSQSQPESEPTTLDSDTLRSDASSAKAADDTVSNNNPP